MATNYAERVRITVAGATGFIGSWAVRALVAAGHEVTALARPQSDTWRVEGIPRLNIVRAAAKDWGRTIAELRPECLLSLDWIGVSAMNRNSDGVQLENLPRQADVVEAALAAGARRIVGVGSQAEYGAVKRPASEETTLSPTTAYGRAKVAAGSALAAACVEAGAEWGWARVFSVFGPLETGGWLLPSIARVAATHNSLQLSSGAQPWSYLYAPDAGTALAELVFNPRALGVYNVGHPAAPPLRESVELFSTALGAADVLRFGDSPGESLRPDTTRLQGLGWEPRWARESAFDATARWFRGEEVDDPFFGGTPLPLHRPG